MTLLLASRRLLLTAALWGAWCLGAQAQTPNAPQVRFVTSQGEFVVDV